MKLCYVYGVEHNLAVKSNHVLPQNSQAIVFSEKKKAVSNGIKVIPFIWYFWNDIALEVKNMQPGTRDRCVDGWRSPRVTTSQCSWLWSRVHRPACAVAYMALNTTPTMWGIQMGPVYYATAGSWCSCGVGYHFSRCCYCGKVGKRHPGPLFITWNCLQICDSPKTHTGFLPSGEAAKPVQTP
jgi:hypothetical protein